MVHRFVPRCQIGPGSNPASVVCGWWFCLWVCRAVGPGPLLLAVPGPAVWCVLGGVLLSRTLAGAVPSALSGLASGFGMGAGRFPVAVTTETTVRAVLFVVVRLFDYSCVVARPTSHTGCCVLVGGWVGCGPYSGRSRHCCCFTPPFSLTSPTVLRRAWVCGGWLLFVLAY